VEDPLLIRGGTLMDGTGAPARRADVLVAGDRVERVLGHFARDRGVLSQQEAVRRMTSHPARQMQLRDRGVIRRGAHADLTLFDAEVVACHASFEHPDRAAAGIEYVIINGTPVLERGMYRADALAGRVLRASPG
jgi:N-acyl-D-aspartate/D-glutamate deacylase